jgi:protein kinase C substrate 80K-H
LKSVREARDKVKSELDELKSFVNLDLGTRGEFYGLYKKTLTFETTEYIYELWPFDKVLQKSKSAASTHTSGTNLGRWEGWESHYTFMKYGSGDYCWNGPNRSVRVELLCGRENQILEVKEPQKCSYTMRLNTPAKCDEEYVNKLRAQLRI